MSVPPPKESLGVKPDWDTLLKPLETTSNLKNIQILTPHLSQSAGDSTRGKRHLYKRPRTEDHGRLEPGILAARYALLAPFTWEYLTVFTTSPNEWRKKRARMGKNGEQTAPPEDDEWEGTGGGMAAWRMTVTSLLEKLAGFGKIWDLPVKLRFIMVLTRNSGTNLFPMILGLFLEIGGTSSRILSTLSNAGACVSVTTRDPHRNRNYGVRLRSDGHRIRPHPNFAVLKEDKVILNKRGLGHRMDSRLNMGSTDLGLEIGHTVSPNGSKHG
ncbi:hypothetical protein DFH09DRAFT_1079513 [Mycena vulgaris]|nr:hypothetical protein DFH09DRAFT_1079513 [Mycena vulgaris]